MMESVQFQPDPLPAILDLKKNTSAHLATLYGHIFGVFALRKKNKLHQFFSKIGPPTTKQRWPTPNQAWLPYNYISFFLGGGKTCLPPCPCPCPFVVFFWGKNWPRLTIRGQIRFVTDQGQDRFIACRSTGSGCVIRKKSGEKSPHLAGFIQKKTGIREGREAIFLFFFVFCWMWRKVLGQGFFWFFGWCCQFQKRLVPKIKKKNGASFCSDIRHPAPHKSGDSWMYTNVPLWEIPKNKP